MITFIDIQTLKVLAKSKGCKYLDDVDADMKDLSLADEGQTFVWVISKNGTCLQKKGDGLSLWFDRYSRSCLSVYELSIECFDEVSISEVSLEQALIDLKIAA